MVLSLTANTKTRIEKNEPHKDDDSPSKSFQTICEDLLKALLDLLEKNQQEKTIRIDFFEHAFRL